MLVVSNKVQGSSEKIKKASDFFVRTGKGHLAEEFVNPILQHLNLKNVDITVVQGGSVTYVFFAKESEVISKVSSIPDKKSASRKILVRNLAKRMKEVLERSSGRLRGRWSQSYRCMRLPDGTEADVQSLFHKIKNEVDNLKKLVVKRRNGTRPQHYEEILGKAFYRELVSNNIDTESIFMEAYNLYEIQNVMNA